MAEHCCPWWMNYLIGSPLRRMMQPPKKLFGDFVKPGMTVLDAGCGMGVFTLALAGMAGQEGLVVAVDLEEKNLAVLTRKALRMGLEQRIETVSCDMGELPLDYNFDFVLAANSVHEVPDIQRFFRRVHGLMNPGGKLLLLEPSFHLSHEEFQRELELAGETGLDVVKHTENRFERKALLTKKK